MRSIKGLVSALVLAGVTNFAHAGMIDFTDVNDLGVTLGGGMTWNNTGGGHVYNEFWDTDDFISFSADTYVNSFEMNAMPWQGYFGGVIGLIDVKGLNSLNETVWSATLNLTNYTQWDNWLTVSVETANIRTLAFTAPGSAPHFNGFWPSVDNIRINDQLQSISAPATLALFGLGLMGLGLSRRKALAK